MSKPVQKIITRALLTFILLILFYSVARASAMIEKGKMIKSDQSFQIRRLLWRYRLIQFFLNKLFRLS